MTPVERIREQGRKDGAAGRSLAEASRVYLAGYREGLAQRLRRQHQLQ